jgi:hypothetical protein
MCTVFQYQFVSERIDLAAMKETFISRVGFDETEAFFGIEIFHPAILKSCREISSLAIRRPSRQA